MEDSGREEKSLEMRVAELEDKLARQQVTEEEMRAYQKVSGLIARGQISVAGTAGNVSFTPDPQQCIISQCIISQCIISQCIIHRCIINRCIISNCIQQCIQQCIVDCTCGPCAGGSGGFGPAGGGFGGLGS